MDIGSPDTECEVEVLPLEEPVPSSPRRDGPPSSLRRRYAVDVTAAP